MKRLLLPALAALVLGLPAGAADETKVAPKSDTYDVVYLAELRPVLLRLHVSVGEKSLSALHEEYIGKIFTFLDVDKNGFLDKDEAAAIPAPGALFNSFAFFGRGVAAPPFNLI